MIFATIFIFTENSRLIKLTVQFISQYQVSKLQYKYKKDLSLEFLNNLELEQQTKIEGYQKNQLEIF